jgi:hypothetical protein
MPYPNLRERAAVQRVVKAEIANRVQRHKEIAAVEAVDLSQLRRRTDKSR